MYLDKFSGFIPQTSNLEGEMIRSISKLLVSLMFVFAMVIMTGTSASAGDRGRNHRDNAGQSHHGQPAWNPRGRPAWNPRGRPAWNPRGSRHVQRVRHRGYDPHAGRQYGRRYGRPVVYRGGQGGRHDPRYGGCYDDCYDRGRRDNVLSFVLGAATGYVISQTAQSRAAQPIYAQPQQTYRQPAPQPQVVYVQPPPPEPYCREFRTTIPMDGVIKNGYGTRCTTDGAKTWYIVPGSIQLSHNQDN